MSLSSAIVRGLRASFVAAGLLGLACEAVTPNFTWDDSLLRVGVCQQGFQRCFGLGRYVCNHELTGWTRVEQCASEQRCDSVNGRCTVCGLREHRCNNGDLQECADNRMEWITLQHCGSLGCNADLESCGACPAGHYQCDEQGELSRCNAGSWGPFKDCRSADNCAVDLDGACRTPDARCVEGSWDCQGSVLRQCDGITWHTMQVCKSDKLCSASLAKLPSNPPADPTVMLLCEPPVCAENAFRCNSNTLQTCKNRTWVDTQSCSGASCNPETGKCEPCVAGHHACDGMTLLRCDGGSWTQLETCSTVALCRASLLDLAVPSNPERCSKPCRRSSKPFCTVDSTVSFCSDEFVSDYVQCVRPDLCVASDLRCDPPKCKPNALRCNGETLQVCDSEKNDWIDRQAPCATGTHCTLTNGGGCVSTSCTRGSYRCNDVFVEQCDDQGVFQRIERCVAPSACLADSGKCEPGCVPGSRRCNPDDAKRVDSCQFDHTWSTATSYFCQGTCDPDIGDCSR